MGVSTAGAAHMGLDTSTTNIFTIDHDNNDLYHLLFEPIIISYISDCLKIVTSLFVTQRETLFQGERELIKCFPQTSTGMKSRGGVRKRPKILVDHLICLRIVNSLAFDRNHSLYPNRREGHL